MTANTHIRLAPKELAYLAERAHGLTNKEVARKYGVSYRTVEGAMRRVLYKLDAKRVAEAVYKATSEGLLCAVFTLGCVLSALQLDTNQPVRLASGRVRPTTSSLRIRTTRRNEYV